MLGRENVQYSFGDMQAANRINEKHFILRIDREIDGKGIRRKLDVLYDSKKGRPSFPPLVMLKTLLLQQWYNLSDPEAEEAICDRLSFQKFLCLSMSDSVPDASLVKSHYRASKSEETKDRDATWTVKQGKPHYGYKAHVSVDEGSELIRKLEITPAHVHDSQVFEELVVGDEHVVYADKGYSGEERKEYLEARGIYCGIMEKAKRGQRLDRWQEKKNKRISKVRCAVERCFGILKEHYRYVRVKYGGLKRNRCQLFLLASAVNLKRMLKLVPA